MDCGKIVYSGHALRRMFERNLTPDAVARAVRAGRVIKNYPSDTPLPSVLLLGFTDTGPVHVVVGKEHGSASCVVITVYRPDPGRWDSEFATRRRP